MIELTPFGSIYLELTEDSQKLSVLIANPGWRNYQYIESIASVLMHHVVGGVITPPGWDLFLHRPPHSPSSGRQSPADPEICVNARYR